jgi:PAS domain S-box-containing protein
MARTARNPDSRSIQGEGALAKDLGHDLAINGEQRPNGAAASATPCGNRDETLARPPAETWTEALLDCGTPAFIADPSGTLLFANADYCSFVNAVDSTLSGAPGEPTLAPPESLAAALRHAGPMEASHSFTLAGATRHIRARYRHLPGADGANGNIVCTLWDRTVELAAEEAARQARARFDDIARLTSDWVWETDGDFNLSYVSSRVTEVIGLPARFLIGQNLFDCGQFEGFEEANRIQHPTAESRVPFRGVNYRMVGVDQRQRLFELSGIPVFEDGSGRFVGYRGTANDITASSEAEARATEAQARLVHAVETMPQGFALYDAGGRLLLCNSRYEELLADGSDAIAPGAYFTDIMNAAAEHGLFSESEQALDAILQERFERHRMAIQNTELRLAEDRWVLITSELTVDGGVVEVWNDITDMKHREQVLREAEEASRRAREQTEMTSRAKSEFLANMSHELRTPLNAVIGFSEILKGEMFGPLGNEQYSSYVNDIYASGTTLLSLINDILDFARADAGTLELTERNMNLRKVAEACCRVLRPRAEEAQITIELELPEDLPSLIGDELKLRQVLLNLLSNGVKFTPAGGQVRLSASADPAQGYVITITDSGHGIDPDQIDKAMSAFGQVDGALNRKFDGAGLGLPLARSLVELHDGTLTLESELGAGTTVTLHFPAERIRARG